MNNERKTVSGRPLTEQSHASKLHIDTKVPEKWVLIDTETGMIWTGKVPEVPAYQSVYSWKQATLEEIGDAVLVIQKNKEKYL